MSYKATLNISGSKSGKQEFDVLSCHFNFRRDYDSRGRPTSAIQDGLIVMELESSEKSLFAGFILNNEELSGKITFYKPDSDQRLKQLEFKLAFLVQYSETMLSTGAHPMTTNITISAAEIKLDEEKVSWNWKLPGGGGR